MIYIIHALYACLIIKTFCNINLICAPKTYTIWDDFLRVLECRYRINAIFGPLIVLWCFFILILGCRSRGHQLHIYAPNGETNLSFVFLICKVTILIHLLLFLNRCVFPFLFMRFPFFSFLSRSAHDSIFSYLKM